MRRSSKTAILLAFMAYPFSGSAKDRSPRTWQAQQTVDPITGASSCVVSATDYVGKMRYSRSGFLYPIIEYNLRRGLLVGVSSGGRFRMPTGDILWRVDDRPFRELKAADNPAGSDAVTPEAQSSAAAGEAAKAMADTLAMTMRLARSAGATSTVASGARAKEMLAELRAGHSLLYRASGASAAYGLPDSAMYRVGQYTDNGLKPIPIDASFGAALAACDITE